MDKNVLKNKKFKKTTISINSLKENSSEQFKEILRLAYDPDTKIEESWVLNCLDLVSSKKNGTIVLPCNLFVTKKKNEITFKFKNMKRIFLIYILLFLLALALSGYSAYIYFYNNKVNIDIDGDGIPDLNIDINNDGKPDVDIDTNGDGKPDLNISYKGNRMAVFNIDTDGDRKPDTNLVTKAKKGKACKLNCDTNGDGWPDLNLDKDGDGKADFDIDTNGDGVPDLNVDTTGNGKCNLMCDEDGDGKCDNNCIGAPDTNSKGQTNNETTLPEINNNGPSSNVTTTGGLEINYDKIAPTEKVLPDDMNGSKPIPSRTFTIKNTSSYPIYYRLSWEVYENTFVTENLKYSLTSTNGGAKKDFETVPKNNIDVARNILIPANSTQVYTLSFRFVGINAEQNIDQNRTFDGLIKAYYDEY